MSTEVTPTQMLDKLVQFYRNVELAPNGPDVMCACGAPTVFMGYGLSSEEAIKDAYTKWQNRKALRAVNTLLR